MTETPWKEISPTERMRVQYGMRKLGNQSPYFSITAETNRKDRGVWREDSGGMLHDMIKKHYPELRPLLKWHLVSEDNGPMHYEANAIYHLKEGNVEHFKSTIVFGAVPGDAEAFLAAKTPDDVKSFLRGRLPQLMAAFERDMRKFDIK